jgi:hypothetical protein
MTSRDRILRTFLVSCATIALIGCRAQSTSSLSREASALPATASATAAPATSATEAPDGSASAPSSSATDQAWPTPAPGAQRTQWLPYGRWATVTADDLRVRYFLPETLDRDSVVATVNAGEALFVIGPGVVGAHGFDWYEVAYGAGVGADGYVHAIGTGLIAGATSQADEQFIALGEESCPIVHVDVVTLAGLTGWTLAHCEIGPLADLEGMLNQPIEGPLTPFAYEPSWLWFSRWFLTEPDEAGTAFGWSGWSIGLHFPPGLDSSALRRGDLVRIDGHINDPAASECRMSGSGEEGDPEPSEDQQQAFRLACSVAFVVDAIEVSGHIDLAED